MLRLKEKKILITGAGGLLGKEFTFSVIQNGAICYALDFDKNKLNKIFLKTPMHLRKKLKLTHIDITKKKNLIEFNNELLKKNIFIDTVINNATNNPGISGDKGKIFTWEEDILIGLTAIKNIIEIFSNKMKKKRKGNIINIGSDLSLIAPDQRLYSHLKNFQKPLSYSVVKHGIVGITKYYASLLAKYNIRVNCLCPGGVKQFQDKKFLRKINKLIPLGRMAKKNEYNGAMVFLCSEESEYMTGQNLIIDGGRTII